MLEYPHFHLLPIMHIYIPCSLSGGLDDSAHRLHAILLFIWQQRWDWESGANIASPVERFVLLNGLTCKGGVGVKRAHEITGILAQFKFNIRLTAVYEMRRNSATLEECRRWVLKDETTPFGWVCSRQRVASGIAMNTMELPRIIWPTNGDQTWFTYAGTKIEIKQLQAGNNFLHCHFFL